jgi:hypothetical protein
MFYWFKKRRNETEAPDPVSVRVAAVAVQIDDEAKFRTTARNAALELGPVAIETLSKRFHSPPDAPDGFGFPERGLSGWLSAWQFAIFEVFYNLGEQALPTLRKIAYGKYDWTQGNAIEVLCRLAADGVCKREVLDELKRKFPEIRYEAQLYAVGPLLSQAATNPNLATVLDELSEVEAFRETIAELTEEHVDADPENVSDENLHGTVTSIEFKTESRRNLKIVGFITVAGLNYFSFNKCGGNARLGITEQTRLLRRSSGTMEAIHLADFSVDDRVALGHYSFTEETKPVTVYPESITIV